MRPLAKSLTTLLAVLAALTLFFGARLAHVSGYFNRTSPVTGGVCRAITGLKGPEDFAIDAAHDAIFVSATDRSVPLSKANPADGLYILKLSDPAAAPVRLGGVPADFHPHGISLYRAPNGALTLMAINHRSNGRHAVEIFDVAFDGGAAKLTLRTTVQGGLLVSPNDLFAVGPDRFFLTNDHATTGRIGRFAEDELLWPHSDVLVFNGTAMRIAVQRMAFPNGIAGSRDGRFLYVTATNERRVLAFSVENITGNLTEIGSLSIPARLDNISTDAQGNLVIAGEEKPGVSDVFLVKLGGDGVPLSYGTLNSGTDIRGASAGAIQNGHLFIGSWSDDKMLDCRMQ